MRRTRIAEANLNKVAVEFIEPDYHNPEVPSVDFAIGAHTVVKGVTLDDLLGLKLAISKAESVLRHRRESAIKARNHNLDF